MIRLLYRALLWIALPAAIIRLAWRSRREPLYRHHLGERFGGGPAPGRAPVVWIHAVSLGETRAAAPLVEWVRRTQPRASVLLTHGTPTGRAAGRALFDDTVQQAWLPWDLPFAARRFLRRHQPGIGLILETEVWPNLLEETERAGVPVFLVNARLSERSSRRYARGGSFIRQAFGRLDGVAAQSEADAARLRALGAAQVVVTGNLKFDLALPPDLPAMTERMRHWYGAGRLVWVLGSTRDGEEALLLEAIRHSALPPEVLVVAVPRHPQRFDAVAALIGPLVPRRSAGGTVPKDARFALGDSLGELLAYYAAGDIAFVGGSLLPMGGQNLIEACAVGRPVIVGRHTFNFSAATAEAVRVGAAIECADAEEVVGAAARLLADPARRESMGQAAARFAAENRGAMDRLADWLAPALEAIRVPARD